MATHIPAWPGSHAEVHFFWVQVSKNRRICWLYLVALLISVPLGSTGAAMLSHLGMENVSYAADAWCEVN
jgi:hypothetical protein